MDHIELTLLWIALLLILSKFANLVERFGQPPVLGELLIGVMLGNLALIGIQWFEPMKHNEIIEFLAELGVIILLFQVGLESNIREMRRVGVRALMVACIGVVVPFVLGTYLVGPWLLPNLSFNAYLFLGATLTATSVGITARVFRDLGTLQSSEAQIVLGAAVIDDVLGLIILAVVTAVVEVGTISVTGVGGIMLTAVVFLVGSIIIGQLMAPRIGRWLSTVHAGAGMKFAMAIGFCLLLAYFASFVGLAPIVGAFAAGLVLDAVHFHTFDDPEIAHQLRDAVQEADPHTRAVVERVADQHADRHVEHLIEPVGHLLAPIFFLVTGMNVQLETLFNPSILLIALGITVVAFAGKIMAGIVAGNVNKWLVGWGMAPRGEVGLIFAASGQALGVVTPEMFSVIIIVILLTTLLTPPVLTFLVKRETGRAQMPALVKEQSG
jgi:Kef-type K+ transport system membrane component KefB